MSAALAAETAEGIAADIKAVLAAAAVAMTIKNYYGTQNKPREQMNDKRYRWGKTTGLVSMAVNLVLFIGKFSRS